jgi:glutathione S-transferase
VASELPVLYHLAISHYSEKARWALSYKGVRHIRRATAGGLHVALSFWLTRGESYTLPVLKLDGRNIGDSTRIIEALELAHPEPALYPADPDERERALALEDWADQELGPYIRRYAFAELSRDPASLNEVMALQMPPEMARIPGLPGAMGKPFVRLRYKAGPAAAAEDALERALAGLARVEAELGGGDYLVGDAFSVADLTAAALLYPAVGPAEGPQLPELPGPLRDFREEYAEHPAFVWTREMYSRHRGRP